jgi:hypothetical protein
MPSSTFPDGSVLTSSALAPGDLNQIVQSLVIQILGINPATDAKAYSKVRIGWIAQPAFGITDDVCTILCTESDDEYDRIRDRQVQPNTSGSVYLADTFTRVWQARLTLYGPNSFDHARLIKSALTLDWTHDALAASNLYLVTGLPATQRVPELFEGQWWERSDMEFKLNEQISESLTCAAIASSEVVLYSERGEQADLVIS